MGTGTRRRVDPPKRRVVSPLAIAQALREAETVSLGPSAGTGVETGGSAAPQSFCAMTQKVPFKPESAIPLGTDVRLVIGAPPSVRSLTGETIGIVSGQAAIAMKNCLDRGYEMAGVVSSMSSDRRSGELLITGRSP